MSQYQMRIALRYIVLAIIVSVRYFYHMPNHMSSAASSAMELVCLLE